METGNVSHIELNYIIVINSYNRSVDLVERSLENSLRQKITPQKVILIDQNKTPLILKEIIKNDPLLQIKNTDYRSVSAARNSLIISDSTEWIFFCDDDGYPAKNYSEVLFSILNNKPEIEILAGNIIRTDNNMNYSPRQKGHSRMKYFRNTKKLMGSNFVVKKSVFNELGRFDENFGVGSFWGSGEETDFCWSAYFAKKNIEYFPELIVYHEPPFNESIKKGFIKAFNYGIGKGALVWKWLIIKKKAKVIYELLEMLIVPFFQILRGLLTIKLQLIPTSIASLAGRIYGFLKASYVNKN